MKAFKDLAEFHGIDAHTKGLISLMGMEDANVSYPSIHSIKGDQGVDPNPIIPFRFSSYDFSEFSAIVQYVYLNDVHGVGDDDLLKIAITEMLHLDKWGEAFSNLGGKFSQSINFAYSSTAQSKEEALIEAIKAENDTIKAYEELYELYQDTTQPCDDLTIILEMITKVKSDEVVHVKTLTNLLNNL